MNISKRNLIIAFGLLCILSGTIVGSLVYVYASGSMTNATFEAGTQIETSSYVVWREGVTYYAKNGSTGVISSSSNASELIQNAIDAVHTRGGGDVLLYGYSGGSSKQFLCDSTITVKQYVHLRGTSAFGTYTPKLSFTSNVHGLRIISSDVMLSNIYIDISVDGYTHAAVLVNVTSSSIAAVAISDLAIYRSITYGYDGASGVALHANKTGSGITNLHIINVLVVGGFQYGFRVSGNDGYANGIEFLSCRTTNTQYGFVIDNSGTGATNNNMFTDCGMQAVDSAYGYTLEGYRIDGSGNSFVNCKSWDMPSGNASVHIISGAFWTELIGCRLQNIFDEGYYTLQLTANSYGDESYLIVKMDHPDTTDWDGNMTGALFYCTTHNCLAYWNGTHLFNMTSTLIP